MASTGTLVLKEPDALQLQSMCQTFGAQRKIQGLRTKHHENDEKNGFQPSSTLFVLMLQRLSKSRSLVVNVEFQLGKQEKKGENPETQGEKNTQNY